MLGSEIASGLLPVAIVLTVAHETVRCHMTRHNNQICFLLPSATVCGVGIQKKQEVSTKDSLIQFGLPT